MSNKQKSGSIWQESMRVGLPKFDEERKDLARIIELLDLKPLHSIASKVFVSRFGVLQAAIEAFFKHEELLLNEHQVPYETIQLHCADHHRILFILNGVHADSMNKKNQTAIEVYETLRTEIEHHVLKFGVDILKHLPAQ